MMYGLKPFNSAELRQYLDILNEAPTAQQAADLEAGAGQVAQAADKFSQGNYASGAMDVAKGANDMANAAGMTLGDKLSAVGMAIKAAGSAGLAQLRGRNPAYAAMGSLAKNATGPAADYVNSPKFAQEFKAGIDAARNDPNADPKLKQMVADYDAGKLTADSFKAYIQRISAQADAASSGQQVDIDGNDDYTVKPTAPQPTSEDQLSEIRRYLDMVEANETPTGAGQFSTKQMGDGTKVSFDPVTGGKTVSGAAGTTNYNVAGQKTSSQTPSIGGFNQSTNYQTGEKTTTGQVGPVGISATQRPDQSTVTTAEVPLGADVTAKVSQGIGFGGAGKDVQQGGNQVTGITTRTAQNPKGTTSSFVGKPTDQQLGQAMQEDDLDDKVMAQYNTPQAKAKSQAIDKAFASGDQKEFDRLGIQSPERIERDYQTMRAGEKAQDAAVRESPSLVMREWMALCR